MAETIVVLDHRDVRAAAKDRVVVTAWHHAPRVEVVAKLEESVGPLHARWADGTALVVVPSKEQPDPAARDALRAFLERQAGHVVGATALLAVSGLKGSMLRGVAKGVIAAMRLPFPIRMSASEAEAAAQVVELLGAAKLLAPPVADVARLIAETSAP